MESFWKRRPVQPLFVVSVVIFLSGAHNANALYKYSDPNVILFHPDQNSGASDESSISSYDDDDLPQVWRYTPSTYVPPRFQASFYIPSFYAPETYTKSEYIPSKYLPPPIPPPQSRPTGYDYHTAPVPQQPTAPPIMDEQSSVKLPVPSSTYYTQPPAPPQVLETPYNKDESPSSNHSGDSTTGSYPHSYGHKNKKNNNKHRNNNYNEAEAKVVPYLPPTMQQSFKGFVDDQANVFKDTIAGVTTSALKPLTGLLSGYKK